MSMTLTLADLENVLRGVAQLSSVKVTQPFPHVSPNTVHLEGAISFHGAPHFWETSIDLRDLNSRQDIVTLIESLLKSFEKASAKAGTL